MELPATVTGRRMFAFLVTPYELFDYAHAIAFAAERMGLALVQDVYASIAGELARLERERGIEVAGVSWVDGDDGPDAHIESRSVHVDPEMKVRLITLAIEDAMPVPYGGFDGLLRYGLSNLSHFGDLSLEDTLRAALVSVESDVCAGKKSLGTLLAEGPMN